MAMEDFRVDVVVGKGPGATAIPLEVAPFTLVGATTRAGLLTGPLRDRFGFVGQMEFYEPAELEQVLPARRGLLGVRADRRRLGGDRRPVPRHTAHRQPAAAPGARLRRGPGRRPGRPGRRPGRAGLYDVDELGLDRLDRAVLEALVGGSAAARSAWRRWPSRWGRSRTRSRRCAEPFLVRAGLLARTPRGRVATAAAWRHLGLPAHGRLHSYCSSRPRNPRSSSETVRRLDGERTGCVIDRPRSCPTARRAPTGRTSVPRGGHRGAARRQDRHG